MVAYLEEILVEHWVAFEYLKRYKFLYERDFLCILLGFAAKNEAGGGGGGNRIPENIKSIH